MQPIVIKCGIWQIYVIGHDKLSVAAFRENKHARMTYIFYKIYIDATKQTDNQPNKQTNRHTPKMMLREKIIEQCLQAMKREDVKKELKQMFHPVIDMIMQEIYPYIYLSVVFVMISFLLTLSIFVLMMRTSYFKQLIPSPLP